MKEEKKTQKKKHPTGHVVAGTVVINPLVILIAFVLYALSTYPVRGAPMPAAEAGAIYFLIAMLVPLAPLVFAARKHWQMARWLTFAAVIVLIMAKGLYDMAFEEALMELYGLAT